MKHSLLLLLLVLLVSACGGSETSDPNLPEPTEPVAQTIVIQPDGNQMKFAQTLVTAKAGTRIRIIMDNTATSPAMHHNVAVLQADAPVAEVGRSANVENNYLPDHPTVIASTPMAPPQSRTEVYLTVPPPGDYPYICTYPGHYISMQGILRSE